jgi:hypothetical protein
MKFLAWDIGIKNLAYSLIDFNNNNNNDNDNETTHKEILEWDIVNLMVDVDKQPKEGKICCESNASGTKCTTKAVYLFSNDCSRGLCRKHQMMIKYKPHKFLDITEKYICCYEINSDKTCGKTALYSRKDNLLKVYCSQHIKLLQKNENFEVYEMKEDKKELVRTVSVLTLAKRLYQHLDNIKDILLNVDMVIIENQPVLKNPTMKTIQILLYGWFIMNGILTDKVKNINFFSASKKLEAYDDKDDAIGKTVQHLSGQYQMNKKLAILFTNEMIKTNTKWFKFFNSHQKKDDLADAYLTNCYYIDRYFKINKFAPKRKTNKKKEAVLDDVDDDTKRAKEFTSNRIIDSDDDEEEELNNDGLDDINLDDDGLEDIDNIDNIDENEEEKKTEKKVTDKKKTTKVKEAKEEVKEEVKKEEVKKEDTKNNNKNNNKKWGNDITLDDMIKFIPRRKVISS